MVKQTETETEFHLNSNENENEKDNCLQNEMDNDNLNITRKCVSSSVLKVIVINYICRRHCVSH